MGQIDMQTRKLLLIEQFARITNEALLAKFEELLMEAQQEERECDLPPLTKEQEATLDSAYQEYLDNPSSARPWDEVKHELFARHGK